MHNDFLIVGPATDPAKIKGMASAVEAMRRFGGEAKATFVSRGDNSGTHQLERNCGTSEGDPGRRLVSPGGAGHGRDAGDRLREAGNVLTDRGPTWRSPSGFSFGPMVERDRILLNIYSVLEPNPAKFPRINATGGRAFADFMVSPEVQDIIRTFGVDKFGEPLFFPDAGKQEESL